MKVFRPHPSFFILYGTSGYHRQPDGGRGSGRGARGRSNCISARRTGAFRFSRRHVWQSRNPEEVAELTLKALDAGIVHIEAAGAMAPSTVLSMA